MAQINEYKIEALMFGIKNTPLTNRELMKLAKKNPTLQLFYCIVDSGKLNFKELINLGDFLNDWQFWQKLIALGAVPFEKIKKLMQKKSTEHKVYIANTSVESNLFSKEEIWEIGDMLDKKASEEAQYFWQTVVQKSNFGIDDKFDAVKRSKYNGHAVASFTQLLTYRTGDDLISLYRSYDSCILDAILATEKLSADQIYMIACETNFSQYWCKYLDLINLNVLPHEEISNLLLKTKTHNDGYNLTMWSRLINLPNSKFSLKERLEHLAEMNSDYCYQVFFEQRLYGDVSNEDLIQLYASIPTGSQYCLNQIDFSQFSQARILEIYKKYPIESIFIKAINSGKVSKVKILEIAKRDFTENQKVWSFIIRTGKFSRKWMFDLLDSGQFAPAEKVIFTLVDVLNLPIFTFQESIAIADKYIKQYMDTLPEDEKNNNHHTSTYNQVLHHFWTEFAKKFSSQKNG